MSRLFAFPNTTPSESPKAQHYEFFPFKIDQLGRTAHNDHDVPATLFQVTATAIDTRGFGVGEVPDVGLVRVPNLLPGETAQAVLEHTSPHRRESWGKIIQRLGSPSPERVCPPCPAFGSCGGCVWQHLGYEAQLEYKRLRVQDALQRVCPNISVNKVVPSPKIVGYRNKGKYVMGSSKTRGVFLGAFAPRTHNLVDTSHCRTVEPAIETLREKIQCALKRRKVPIYDEKMRTGQLRYAILRSNARGDTLATLITTGNTCRATMNSIAQELAAHTQGVIWMRNDSTSGSLLSPAFECLVGRPAIVEEIVAGVPIELGPSEFFQINREQAHNMAEAVVSLARADEQTKAMDVYCGVGLFSFALAQRGATVLGIENHPISIQRARNAAKNSNLQNKLRFEVANAAALTQYACRSNLIVVNPPRKGLGPRTCQAIVDLEIPQIAYVSCGPESLARDLAILCAGGYQPDAVQPFDLMPGTSQVETLVLLRRSSN